MDGTGSSTRGLFTFSPISVTDHTSSCTAGLRVLLPAFLIDRKAFVARALKVFDLDIDPP